MSSPLVAQSHQAILQLPLPDGCHAVGTKVVVLRDVSRNRDLLVTFWYPSQIGSVVAPYMDKKTAAAIAEDWKLPTNFVDRIRTNARLRARIDNGGPFPLILLEHGSGVVPAIYTVLAEGLASQGSVRTEASEISEQLSSWTQENLPLLATVAPSLLDQLSDRQQDGAERC